MRHIIVHLIRGEASKAHENITKDLTEKFQTFPIHERIAPHITLKRWFELDQDGMDMLYKKLEDFSNSHTQTEYLLRSFGNFGKDVIFVDVIPSKEMTKNVDDLSKVLHEIPNLTFDQFDTNKELHATVAFGALKPFDFDEIWNYLASSTQPDYQMKFDNITVMKREKDAWEVVRVWEIK